MKEFTQNGITLVFYQKPNDEKFSFLIKDNEELTEKLLASVKIKRVKEMDIKYAANGIFEKIKHGDFAPVKKKQTNSIFTIEEQNHIKECADNDDYIQDINILEKLAKAHRIMLERVAEKTYVQTEAPYFTLSIGGVEYEFCVRENKKISRGMRIGYLYVYECSKIVYTNENAMV
jgi:hypothetical protein